MTLAELQAETLSQKHRRLAQAKCPCEEIYTSSVWCRDEEVTYQNRACLDCGKSWHNVYRERSPMPRPTIEELEHILAGGDGPQRVTMLPNGEIRAVSDWQLIESAPKDRKIIAGYFNGCGKWRSVMACYYPAKTLDWNSDFDGGDEDGFAPEGWYEEIENSETIFPMATPTHWMLLPKPPALPSTPNEY